jgi:hypothetical protein
MLVAMLRRAVLASFVVVGVKGRDLAIVSVAFDEEWAAVTRFRAALVVNALVAKAGS